MSATVQCNICGRIASARITEDSPEINYMEVEPEWRDNEVEYGTVRIDGTIYWYEVEDVECKLFKGLPCEHDDYDIIEVNYDYD